MSLRAFVFDRLKDDHELNTLGINTDTLYPTQAPDSPRASAGRWMVLAWGSLEPRLGRESTVRRRLLTVWMYDKEPDYGAIDSGLQRAFDLLYPLKAVNVGDGGWITEVLDSGMSDDLYDPGYEAVTKNWALTIVANGN